MKTAFLSTAQYQPIHPLIHPTSQQIHPRTCYVRGSMGCEDETNVSVSGSFPECPLCPTSFSTTVAFQNLVSALPGLAFSTISQLTSNFFPIFSNRYNPHLSETFFTESHGLSLAKEFSFRFSFHDQSSW